MPLSTAQLYTFSQPGHSLWGLNQSQPFNPAALGSYGGRNQTVGGIITFGGGVAIYKNGKIIGGLGVSGDTACTDHEIAKRVRNLAGLNPPAGQLAGRHFVFLRRWSQRVHASHLYQHVPQRHFHRHRTGG